MRHLDILCFESLTPQHTEIIGLDILVILYRLFYGNRCEKSKEAVSQFSTDFLNKYDKYDKYDRVNYYSNLQWQTLH